MYTKRNRGDTFGHPSHVKGKDTVLPTKRVTRSNFPIVKTCVWCYVLNTRQKRTVRRYEQGLFSTGRFEVVLPSTR